MLSPLDNIGGGGIPTSFGPGVIEAGVGGAVLVLDWELALALAADPFGFRPDGRDVFFFDPFFTRCSIVTSSTICQYPPLPSSSSGCRSVIADFGLTLNAQLVRASA